MLVTIASVIAACVTPADDANDEPPIFLPPRSYDASDASPSPSSPTESGQTSAGEDAGATNDAGKLRTANPCTVPSACGGDTPVCCGDLALDQGIVPTCPVLSLKGICSSACPTSFSHSCPGASKTRICAQASDCDQTAPAC